MADRTADNKFWYLQGLTSTKPRALLPPLLSTSGLTAIDPFTTEDYGLDNPNDVEYRPYNRPDSPIRQASRFGYNALAETVLRSPGTFNEVLNIFNEVRRVFLKSQGRQELLVTDVVKVIGGIMALPILQTERSNNPIASGEISDAIAIAAVGSSGISSGLVALASNNSRPNIVTVETDTEGLLDVDALIAAANTDPSPLITLDGIQNFLTAIAGSDPTLKRSALDRSVCPVSNGGIATAADALFNGLEGSKRYLPGYQIPGVSSDDETLAAIELGALTIKHIGVVQRADQLVGISGVSAEKKLAMFQQGLTDIQDEMANLLERDQQVDLEVEDLKLDLDARPAVIALEKQAKIEAKAASIFEQSSAMSKRKPKPTSRTGGSPTAKAATKKRKPKQRKGRGR